MQESPLCGSAKQDEDWTPCFCHIGLFPLSPCTVGAHIWVLIVIIHHPILFRIFFHGCTELTSTCTIPIFSKNNIFLIMLLLHAHRELQIRACQAGGPWCYGIRTIRQEMAVTTDLTLRVTVTQTEAY